jgi:hypothetical protein
MGDTLTSASPPWKLHHPVLGGPILPLGASRAEPVKRDVVG